MKTITLAGLAIAAVLASAADAQTLVYWPAPVPAAQQAQMSYFPMGTALTLRTRAQVSTKVNRPGDRVYLEVAESVSYNGQVVVPVGSVAVAEVAFVQKNGHFGKKGKLEIRPLYIETPNGTVRLSGQATDEGTSGTITSVATMLIVSPLGFLVHGTSAQLPPGTLVRGYLAEDMRFMVQPTAALASTQASQPRPGFGTGGYDGYGDGYGAQSDGIRSVH